MRPDGPMSQQPRDLGPSPQEAEELNRSTATATFLQSRWFRWLLVGIAVITLVSFIVPLLPLGGAPQAQPAAPDGVRAPDFTLPAADGRSVSLADLRARNDYVVIVFYRGVF